MGRPLRAVYTNSTYSTGVREMSDSDINNLASEVILAAAITNSGLETVVRVNPGAGNWLDIGTAYDIINAPVGDHPASNTVASTYTMYQSELAQTPSITARPVHYVSSGGVHQIKEMTNQEIIDSIMPAVVQTSITGGRGAYYLSLTSSPPVGGTWVSRSVMTDTYYNVSNVYTTDSYTLWQKTSGASLGTTRPLKRSMVNGETRLVEMTDIEIGNLYTLIGEYVRTTGIGRYAFQFNAPVSGTWTNRGAYIDTTNVLSPASYANFYSGIYTGFYGITYSGTYSGIYTGSYSGGAYSGTYTGLTPGTSYSGSYSATYTRVVYGTTVIPYTGYYTRSFSGSAATLPTADRYEPSGISYTGTLIFFPSFYSRVSYGPSYAEAYNGTIAGPSYSGLVIYYYFIPVPASYTSQVEEYFTGAEGQGEAFQYVSYSGFVPGPSYSTIINIPAQSGEYISFTSPPISTPTRYGPPFAASYSGQRIQPDIRFVSFSGSTLIPGTPGTPGSPGSSTQVPKTSYYGPIPTTDYVPIEGPSYSGTYTSSTPASYSGVYTGSFSGTYTGSYSRTIGATIPRSYSGTYTGSFSGLTVQSTVTTTTYNLWVRTA